MICQKCNTENKETNKFCYSCGNELIVIERTCNQEDEFSLMKNQKSSQKSKSASNKVFRTILALLACFGIFMIFAFIMGALGSKHGGGIIPMLIMFALIGFTWRSITGAKEE